jgi:hypothetical protein
MVKKLELDTKYARALTGMNTGELAQAAGK